MTTNTKDFEILSEVTEIEVQALIEITTTEAEITAITEKITIIDIIIADQILDIQPKSFETKPIIQ